MGFWSLGPNILRLSFADITHLWCVETQQALCGFHTGKCGRAVGGRFAESLEALCSTHTHLDRFPALRGDNRAEPCR